MKGKNERGVVNSWRSTLSLDVSCLLPCKPSLACKAESYAPEPIM